MSYVEIINVVFCFLSELMSSLWSVAFVPGNDGLFVVCVRP
jgi:hypothetical protein